jgi:glycosyltransferase involved in cell wall biosynthesis
VVSKRPELDAGFSMSNHQIGATPIKMRILICSDFLIAGGIERQTTEITTRLEHNGFEPTLIYMYGDHAGRHPHFLPQIEAEGITVYGLDLGWSPLDKVRGVLEIVRLTWKVRPAILQAMNYHSNLLCRMARPFLPPDVKLVGSVRGNYSPKQLRYEQLSQWLCACIVTNGLHLKKQLLERAHIPADKVTYIPNGIDLGRFASSDAIHNEARQTIAADAGHVFVSVGRITAEKMMHYIPQAVGLLKRTGRLADNARFFIVGTADELDMMTLLTEAIAKDNLERVVIYQQETQRPELYYHAADVVILFSPAEGMPNVALESLAAGKPVIISEGANAAGIITDGVTGWVVRTGDVAHLAEILDQVSNLPRETLHNMRSDCEQTARLYSMENMIAAYKALYENLVNKRPVA